MGTNNNSNETKTGESGRKTWDIMETPRPVVTRTAERFPGEVTGAHDHPRSQLLYAASGVMTVKTDKGIWVVPPFRAVWIPAHTLHQVIVSTRLSMRTLYIEPEFFKDAPGSCCVISVSPLLKELILEAVKFPRLYPLNGPEERIMSVIVDQIQRMDITSVNLTIPKDPRLKAIYLGLDKNPGDRRTLEEWGKDVGATRRTLTRLFLSETAMTFGHWRQQIRILKSLTRLAENEPVTTIALDMGYENPSAFISMFRKALGKTPGQYFASH